MNKKIVANVIGKILLLEAAMMVLPLIVSFLYNEGRNIKFAFAISILILIAVGGLMSYKKPENTDMYSREGLVIAGLSWIALSFFGGLPFYFSGEIPSLVDCFFESVSGFTTTGSSIIPDLHAVSYSIMFWRSLAHFVGGMGVLVLALALLPKTDADSVHVMRAEIPGPTFGKMLSKLSDSAKLLYKIYLVMTAVLVVLLMLGKMPFFDALLHAFGTAATGGFDIKNGSVAYYDSTYIDMVIGIGMLLFGINFNVYYMILLKKTKDAFKSQELHWYLIIVAVAFVLVFFNVEPLYDSLARCARDVFFSVTSVITTTGYTTADHSLWPGFSKFIFLMLMFCGACTGSTAGGLKISRVVIMFKSAAAAIKRSLSPNRMVAIDYEGRNLSARAEKGVATYFLLYTLAFWGIIGIIALTEKDFLTSFSAVAATFSNIGPELAWVSPEYSFARMTDLSKIVLSLAMLAGRLEIVPIAILFLPGTWRNK